MPVNRLTLTDFRSYATAIVEPRPGFVLLFGENGVATEEIPADYGNDGLEIGFNARYLLDILGEIDGDTVEVHLADAAAPTLLRENDKSNALYVLMPMRV